MEQNHVNPPRPEIFALDRDGRPFDYVVRPPGWIGEIVRDPKHDHTPAIVSGAREFADTTSFKAYFDRFKDDRTLVTASRAARSVRAELDYHRNATTPSPGKHNVSRKYTLDRRFTAWKAFSGKYLPQVKFAEFLEDHLEDVRAPAQATLLKNIVQFKALQKITCVSAVDLQNGDVKLEYVQDTTRGNGGKNDVVLPDRITIRMPVLEFEGQWEIHARLRYSLDEGKVTFMYELINIEDVEDLAFRTAITELAKTIGSPILLVD